MRARVTATATLALLGVLVAVGAGLVVAQRRLLTDGLEDTLADSADFLAAAVAAGDVPEEIGGLGDDDTRAQVVTADGTVVASTPNLAGAGPIDGAPPTGRAEIVRTVEDLDGEADYRVLSRTVRGPSGPTVVHVASSLDDIDDSARTLALSLTVAVPLAATALALLVWRLVGRTLGPVEAIRREVAGLDGRDLQVRVPEPGTGDEIDRLARTMNAMLGRVEDAVGCQRRFVADASHELRSPLTRIRAELEVDLAHTDGADLAATHRSVLEEATSLQRLLEDLLHLARSDAGAPGGPWSPVDLDEIVLRQARTIRAGGDVAVDLSGVTAARVQGDPAQLARAIANVTDNAVRHAASSVALTVSEGHGGAVVTISDDGPGIPAADRERVFERFTRLDDARSRDAGGTGLGLAIARDIVHAHHGTIVVDADHTAGARFVIVIPGDGVARSARSREGLRL
ncbi:MAG: HAMP domain-containing sensor histidine kinase [Acidimicrobiia bacterium]